MRGMAPRIAAGYSDATSVHLEGYSEAQISGLFETRCEVYVKDAVEILETIL